MKKTLKLLLSSTLLLTGILASCGEKPTSEVSQEQSQQTSEPAVPQALKSADAYIHASYKDMALDTPVTFTLPAKHLECTLEWTVNVTSGDPEDVKVVPAEDGNTVSIVVRALDDEHISEYTLTYVIKLGEDSLTRSYNHRVPLAPIYTPAQYYAAADDVIFKASGIVTCLIPSQKSLYLQAKDGSGSFYVYQAKNYEAIAPQLGQEISFVGTRTTYSGTAEVKDATLTVVSADPVAVAPIDYTELFRNAEGMKDKALVAKQGLYVKIEGVTIAYEENNNGYYHFTLGENKSYLRISGSSCPLTEDEQTAFINGHKDHVGWTANVQGVINLFNGSFYLTPVGAGAEEYVSLPAKTDAEAVAYEKGNLTFKGEFAQGGEFDVLVKGASYTDQVAISWESSNAELISFANGKATVVIPSETTEVTVTATLTAGEARETKEFTVKLVADQSFISQALNVCAGLANKAVTENAYLLIGTVSEITTAYNEQYKNVSFMLSDGTRSILIYRYTLEDAAEIKVGDYLAFTAKLTNYSGTLETSAGTYEKYNLTSLKDAAALGLGEDAEAKKGITVYGMVSKIDSAYSEQYNNITVTITEGEDSFYIYRLAGGDDISVGDYLLITGDAGSYKGAAQMAQGAKYVKNPEVIPAAPVEEYVYVGDGTEANPYTVEDCLELAKEFSVSRYDSTNKVNVYGDLAMVYVKGVVAVEGSDKGAYQQNMQLQSTAEGKKLTIYTVNEAETVKDVRLNDEVVIKGYLMNYNGTIEISNAKGAEDAEPIYPEFISVVRGTNAISVDAASSANAHVTLDAETGANESEFTFEVTVDDGYDLVAVTVNGVAVEKDAETNKYTGKVSGATVVKVTTKESGAEVAKSFTWEYADTITDGYKLDASASAKDTYYQDKSGSEGFALTFTRVDNEKIYEGTPEGKISLTVKVGGGSARDPLNNNVIAYLIDATGAKIEGSEVVVTTKVEEKTGKEYTVELPQVADAYGLVISHEKEASYNARVFSVSFTYPEA